MAGTLTISTLSDGTNSTSSTNCIQGSAKAWATFGYVGAVMVTNASYNISSITRSSAGDYVLNFTNALADSNYAVFLTICGANNTSSTIATVKSATQFGGPSNKTTSQVEVIASYYTAGMPDLAQLYIAVFR